MERGTEAILPFSSSSSSAVALPHSLSWRLCSVAALLWAAALPLAAWLREIQGGAASAFAFLIYSVASVVCHQRPDRSFHLAALPLPVCARCAGIYAGAAVVALWALLGHRYSCRSSKHARAWLAAAAAPVALSLLYEWGTGHAPSNIIRAATGLLVGSVAGAIVLALMHDEARTGHEALR
jgi:uncharacterized membrane protein